MLPMFSWKRLPLTAAFAVFCWLIILSSAQGAAKRENPKEVSWHISALMVTYDNERQLYVAEDEVVITGGKTRLEADYVEFSNQTKEAFAQGDVLFISGEDTITCNAMQINLATETGSINKGTIFVQEGNYYISGKNLRKTGAFTYDAQEGSITTCDGENPDWKITGKDIKVTVEGTGTAKHTALWAKKMPVLYSPYLIFPLKTKRQTGLLIPRISSSDRKGYEYEQPLFIAISRNTDATLYADYMSDRGVKVAGEFRYILSPESKGMMMVDFLEDRKRDDGTADTNKYSFSTTPQRTNSDRYWFRMKHDQGLPAGFKAKLDLDIVSDADYLQEFRDGFTGFDDTNRYFEERFGRSLDEYDDTTRKNSLIISRAWSQHNLNLVSTWFDDVVARRQNTADNTLQTLPGIEFDAIRQQIGSTGLYYSMGSEFRSFYRKDTTATLVNGQRADFYPRLYYPIKLGRSFSFDPHIGVRGTAWHTDDFTDINGDDDSFRTRGLYDLGASLSTTLDRVFTLNTGVADKLKHEIIPKLEYGFRPNEIQDDLPYFDEIDRLDEENLITWSLTNVLTGRKTMTLADGTTTNQYRELAWFKLYQSYDIRHERDDETATEKPWQDVKLKFELNPFQYLSSSGDIAVNPYNGHFTEAKVGATIRDNRGDSLYSSYRYEIHEPHTWLNILTIQITRALLAYYSLESDIENSRTVENKAGIRYTRDCWAIGLEFKDASADKSIAFMIRLRGIGEFGTQ